MRRGKAARPYQDRISEIKIVIEEELVPELTRYDMCFNLSSLISSGIVDDYCLAEISEFGALLQKSHEFAVPVFKLSDEQIGDKGPVFEQLSGNRQRFGEIFSKISQVILNLIP